MINMSLPTSEQFERFLEFSRRPSDLQRRDYAQLCASFALKRDAGGGNGR